MPALHEEGSQVGTPLIGSAFRRRREAPVGYEVVATIEADRDIGVADVED
jgi:hypothetical protein